MVEDLQFSESGESHEGHGQRHGVHLLMMHEVLDFSDRMGETGVEGLRGEMVGGKGVVHQLDTAHAALDLFERHLLVLRNAG